jgi:hypothetical protein
MKVALTASWELSNEYSASSSEHTMLVNRTTGEGYGPEDLIRVYREWPIYPARVAVDHMLRTNKKLTDTERQFAERFIEFGK